MKRLDIKISVNKILLEMVQQKLHTEFGKEMTFTDCLLVVMLLSLYKAKDSTRSLIGICHVLAHPSDLDKSNFVTKTSSVYSGLLEMMKKNRPHMNHSQLIEKAMADYLSLDIAFYTDCISPLYTMCGYKNVTMQAEVSNAIEKMKLPMPQTILVDACTATGSLFFGLKTYPWERVVLNDLNPLRTNFLNVIQKKPLKLIKKLLNEDFSYIKDRETKNSCLKKYRDETAAFYEKHKHYKK